MTDTHWKCPATPAELNALGKHTAAEFLDNGDTEAGPHYLRGTLPVRVRA